MRKALIMKNQSTKPTNDQLKLLNNISLPALATGPLVYKRPPNHILFNKRPMTQEEEQDLCVKPQEFFCLGSLLGSSLIFFPVARP